MSKFKVGVGKGAELGAQPPAQPQEKKEKERKPIHPGLEGQHRCRKCGTFLAFHLVALSDIYQPLVKPFGKMEMAFCECGIWTRDERDRIRWMRYSSGQVEVAGGEVFAP